MVPESQLYLFDHHFLFLGKVKDNSEHKHHAVQIIVGIDGPVTLCYKDFTKQCHCALIAPDTSHRIVDNQTSQLHLLIDNESIIARKLDEQFFQNQKVYIPDNLDAQQFVYNHVVPKEFSLSCEDAFSLANGLLNTLVDLASVGMTREYDPRILQVLDWLHQSSLEKVVAKKLAQEVYLSESRFIHLFTQEVGIPLRKYILWLRINRAVKEKSAGKSLTDAAYSSGFSDSAHLSRTFRSMFGLTLSSLFKNSRFIQVFSCSTS